MSKVAVVGAGMMGSALTLPLVDRGHDVRLVGTPLDADIISQLKSGGIHKTLKLPLPDAVRPFDVSEIAEALEDAELLALGVSSAGVAWAAEAIAPFFRGQPLFSITKGLEWAGDELRVLPDVLQSLLPRRSAPAAIAGPCIAGELARRAPTCVVLTGRDSNRLDFIRSEIETPYYRVWTSADVVGVEVCAALKNAYAMGIAFGVGLNEAAGGSSGSIGMHNLESAVFAQSIVEMQRTIRLLGGDPQSAAALAGVGDLDVTTNGGRTGRFGRWLGLGLSVDAAIEKMDGATLECLDILSTMKQAIVGAEASGRLDEAELPLLRHLIAVAIDGEPVDVPLTEFFGGRS